MDPSSSQQKEESLGFVDDSPGSNSNNPFSFPLTASNYQNSPSGFSASGNPPAPFGYRRGPGRPRKDGNTAFQRQAGRGQTGRIKMKSQLLSGFHQSSSSPSTSSPDTPLPGDSLYFSTEGSISTSNDGPKCSFCYLPESSLLGQGELLKHPKSVDFDPSAVSIDRNPETESHGDPSQTREPQLHRHPRTKEELAVLFHRGEIFSEIEIVGLPDDLGILDLINQASDYSIWAHFCCGAWSDGVIQAEDYSLINVDKAVASGLRQRCSGCGSYGATISCKQKGCTKKFHYPCASGYGGFLDIKNLVFLCPEHILKAPDVVKDSKDADCAKCKKSSGVGEQLFCTSCGQHFHGRCLDPPVEPCLQTRAGWLCNECKICQTCKNATDDDKMLVCECCDKGYHTYCMQPPLSSVPKQSWKCKFCRMCKDCGSRRPGSGTSSRWHLNFSICDSCYQQRNKGLICPVCNRAYRYQKQKSMMQCQGCQKYIHYECDAETIPQGLEKPELDFYLCPICKDKHPDMANFPANYANACASVSASPSISTVGEGEEDEEYLTNLIKNELGDSLSGAESSFSEWGPGGALGDVDFSALAGQEDSNLSGIQSESESGGFSRPSGSGMSAMVARKFGTGPVPLGAPSLLGKAVRKRQYRRSRSGGKGPDACRPRLPPVPGRRRGRPSKYQSQLSINVPPSSYGEENAVNGGKRVCKDKDDEEYIHTVVVTSSKDEFVMCQDMCVICGSFGKGEEGRLIACTQCGQCYHPYCANVKMSSVVLRRGWRCLDCTTCEGCGNGEDEPHLLLCDDCDLSYHTYCLEPPLEHIPQGAWRCHWCAKCQRCGNLLPAVQGVSSSFSTTFCVACESLVRCARCNQHYREGDTMIVCQNCARWCHGKCETLLNEELLETASERGFRCVYCRPPGTHCLQAVFSGQAEEDVMTISDGVVLTKLGVETSAITVAPPPPAQGGTMGAVRKHLNDSRGRGGALARASRAIDETIDEVTAAVAKTFTGQISEDLSGMDFESINYELMSPAPSVTTDRDMLDPFQPRRRGGGTRGRRIPKLGVGGFIVRSTRQRISTTNADEPSETPEGSISISEEPSQSGAIGEYSGMISPALDAPGDKTGHVIKRRKRRSRKGLIEEGYPSIIQDSFFGARCMTDPSVLLGGLSMGGGSPSLEEQVNAFAAHNSHIDTELSHMSADQLRKQEAGPPPPVAENPPLSLDDLDDDLFRQISGNEEMLVDSESLFKMLDNIGGSGLQDSRGHSPIGNMDTNPMDSNPPFTDLQDVDSLMCELQPPLGADSNSHQGPSEESMQASDHTIKQDTENFSEISNAHNQQPIAMTTVSNENLQLSSQQLDSSAHFSGQIPSNLSVHRNMEIGAELGHPINNPGQPQHEMGHPMNNPGQPQHEMGMPGGQMPHQSQIVQPGMHSQQQYLNSLQLEMNNRQAQESGFPPLNPVGPGQGGVGVAQGIPGVASGFFPPGHMGGDAQRGIPQGMHPGSVPQSPNAQMFQQGMRQGPMGMPPGFSPGMVGAPGGPRPLMSPGIQSSMAGMDHPTGLHSQTSTTGSTSGSDLKSQLERWEQDEPLGNKATIASVLYANIHHMDLKVKFPLWSERVKHIQKSWRLLSAEDRAKWVQLARENRAACRQKRKSSKLAGGAGSSTPPTPAASSLSNQGPLSFMKQESIPMGGHSELSRSDMDSNPSTPQTAGPRTPSTPIDAPMGPYSPRGNKSLVFPELGQQQQVMPPGQQMHNQRMPFPQDQQQPMMQQQQQQQQQQQRFSSPAQSQQMTRFPQQVGMGPTDGGFKVPQRPSQESLGQGQEAMSMTQEPQGPVRPGSLMLRDQNPQLQGHNPQLQHSMLDDLMDAERRDRGPEGQFGLNQPRVSVQSQLTVSVGGQMAQFPGQQAGMQKHMGYGPPQQGWPGRFPMGPSGGMMRPVMPSGQPMFKDAQHEALVRKMDEVTQLQRLAEEDLARLRKLKKTITAKQRQLKKQELELGEEDKLELETLTRDIQDRQKKLESAKKQVKLHTATLHDYEVKNGLAPPAISPGSQPGGARMPMHQQGPMYQAMMNSQRAMMSPHEGGPRGPVHPQFMMRGSQMMSARMRGPMPPGTFPAGTNPGVSSSGMTSPYKVTVGDNNPFSETFEERERIERQKQAMYGMRQPYPGGQTMGPGQLGVDPSQMVPGGIPQRLSTPFGDSCDSVGSGRQSTDSGGKKKVYKKRRKKASAGNELGSEFGPAADMLMNIPRPPLDDLDSPSSSLVGSGQRGGGACGVTGWVRDVYETVQYLVNEVSLEVDGDDGDRNGNALLKSLLETNSPSEKGQEPAPPAPRPKPLGRPPSAAGLKRGPQFGSSPVRMKRGKKGPKGRANVISALDDHAVFVERVGIELKALPRLSVQEPFPRADRFSCQIHGVTNLPETSDKPLVIADKLGSVRLSFLPDFYSEDFGKPPLPKPQPPVPMNAGAFGNVGKMKMGRAVGQSTQGPSNADQLLAPTERRGVPEPVISGSRQTQAQKSQAAAIIQQQPKTMIQQLKALNENPLELIYETGKDMDEEEFSLCYPSLKTAVPSEGRVSPSFRLMLAIPVVRPVPPDPPRSMFYQTPQALKEVKQEVPCSVTLSAEAAKNVSNVMQGLAILLNLSSPIEYQIETPPHTPEKEGSIREVQDQNNAQICLQCRSMIHSEVVKKRFAELGLTPKEDDKDFAIFCSNNCYARFASNYKSQPMAEIMDSLGFQALSDTPPSQKSPQPSKTALIQPQQIKVETGVTENSTELKAGALSASQLAEEDFKLDEIIQSVVGGTQVYTGGPKEAMVHVRDLPQPEEMTGGSWAENGRKAKADKRWKGHRWQTWSRSFLTNLTRYQDTLNMLIDELKSTFCPTVLPVDTRKCELCVVEGDGQNEGSGRLLNLDAARWLHVNCALWSSEVYETVGGALINVDAAVRRSQTVSCVHCSQIGATIPCYKLRCEQKYHFPCAMQTGCGFTPDKTVFCPEHKVGEKLIDWSKMAVLRRLYIERDEDHLIAKLFQQGEVAGLTLRVGSLIFQHIGQLLPHQLRAFHTKDYVYPVGYSVTRFYWSPAFVNRRVRYHCGISDHNGNPQFSLTYSESGCAELALKASAASDVWNKILEPLEYLRHKKGPSDQLKLFPRYLTGELLFGLSEPSILKMIESLPGVDTLLTYSFKYGRNPLMDLPLAVNPSGCARTEPRFRTYLKRHHITHAAGNTGGTAASPTGGGSLTWQELALMFGKLEKEAPGSSSKWSLYKKMKAEWRNTVHLGRSKIQGLGLYAKRDIEMNSMIIEYLGDVIRNEVAERREKLYQQQNRGVYMFRLDWEKVVDATMSGGPARYINHSCDPNCATQLLTINGELKIVVMACRPISKHEELTYDYQFDFEDESSKLPCLCGAPNCRKWMN